MMKKKTPTAAAPAAKRRKSGGSSGVGPRTRARDNNGEVDLISTLPDALLGTIISLLSTKDGARTQVLAHRWRPLWRSAPLNLDAKHLSVDQFQRVSIVSRILSDHPGPARCFSFPFSGLLKDKYKISMDAAKIEAWFDSRALDNLQELEISFEGFELMDESKKGYPLPSSMFRLASTLLVATIEYCDFPNEIAHSEILQMGCLHISSPTLRAISFIACCSVVTEELVIVDTPLLERLLFPCLDGDGTIRGMIPSSLSNSICNVKVLALKYSVHDMNVVLDVLRCFPFLENLCVIWNQYLKVGMKKVRRYDPLDPIKCLETHLKVLVLKNYQGDEEEVDFVSDYLNAHDLSVADPFHHSFVDGDVVISGEACG
ncbi:putative FBD-associated F-box protein At1g78730 [Lolium perenne]|uniref:putative FBD-associated F-box protein At1g78730 n=1 Tax=Lolium perenne TaxID=4522 RepID=UPI003A9A4EC2